MFTKGRVSIALAAAVGLLAGGTLTTVTPAVGSLAVNWTQAWKHEIKPRADKRYYTKTQANAKYETKAGHNASLGDYYTKTQSNQKFAPYPTLIRGAFMDLNGTGATEVDSPISFGVELAEPPTVHYIKVGDPIPTGCGGTVVAPDAAAGHLCVFEQASSNLTTSRGVANPATGTTGSAATYGAYVYGHQAVEGQSWFRGTWALRPGTVVVPSATVAEPVDVNAQVGSPRLAR